MYLNSKRFFFFIMSFYCKIITTLVTCILATHFSWIFCTNSSSSTMLTDYMILIS